MFAVRLRISCCFARRIALYGSAWYASVCFVCNVCIAMRACVCVCACVCACVCDRRARNTFSSSSRIDVVVSVWHHGTDHCESELRSSIHNLVSNFLSITALFNARRNVWKRNPALGLGSRVTLSAHKLSCELLCVHGTLIRNENHQLLTLYAKRSPQYNAIGPLFWVRVPRAIALYVLYRSSRERPKGMHPV